MTPKTKINSKPNKASPQRQDRHRISYLASLIDNISDALISTDMDFHILEWNRAAESIYGWTAAEVMRNPLGEFVQNQAVGPTWEDIIEAVLDEGIWKGEVTQNRKDGSRFPVMLSVSQVRDKSGKPMGFVAINRDITEHVQAEQEVTWLASFPERNPNPIVEIDSMGKVFYMNPAAQHRFPDLETQGLSHPWLRGLEDEIAKFQNGEFTELQRDVRIGETWYSQPLYYVPETARLRVYGTDITERKWAEGQIVQMKRLYATLSQINQTIVHVRNHLELYQSICDVAVRFGEFALAWIGLLDESTGDVRPVAAKGLDVKQWPFRLANINEGPLANGLIATAIRTSKVVTSDDIQIHEGMQSLHTLFEKYGYHASAVIPLRLRGRTIGILSLVSVQAGFFQAAEEIHLLEEMGLDISFALDTMETEAERKQTEEELQRTNRWLFASQRISATGGWAINLKTGAVWVSPEARRIYGADDREPTLPFIQAFPLPEYRPILDRALQDLITGSRPYDVEFQIARGADGAIADLHSLAEYNPTEQLIVGVIQDITDRKRAEKALRASEERYRSTLDHMLEGCQIMGFDWRFLYVNDVAAGYSRHSKEELIGRKNTDVFPGIEKTEGFKVMQRAMEERIALQTEQEILYPDGIRRWFDISLQPVSEGIFILSQDITERKLAEHTLRESEARFSTIFRSSPTGINIFRLSDGRSVDVNEAFLELIGFSREEVLGHTAVELDLFVDGEAGKTWMEKLFAGQAVRGQDTKIRRRSGEIRDTLAALDLIEIGGEKMVVVIVTDITERKHYEEELRALNAELEHRVAERTAELHQTNTELEHANRVKDEFLATMSHELRTPLNSILGLSETLLEERRGSLNEYQRKSLHIVASSGHHLLELINDILDVSKIEAGKLDFHPQPVSVDELCRSSLAFIKAQAARKSITVTYTNQSEVVEIFADPRRFKQILVNLLTNAVKFTPEKGEVILQVKTRLEQDLIQFTVIDNGIGIAHKDLQRLFQPFVQVDSRLNRQHEGTGLGLALVQKLTDLHGGSVQVESEVGKGSRFTINLARKQYNIAEPAKSRPGPGLMGTVQTDKMEASFEGLAERGIILLAEDNLSNSMTMGEYVESCGYKVVAVHDGLEAIVKTEEVKPDLILMDIQMPAMNGLEAIAHLRRNTRFADTPIIALTALAMPGDRERCLLAGANEYMSKPVSLKALRQTIEDLLQYRNEEGSNTLGES